MNSKNKIFTILIFLFFAFFFVWRFVALEDNWICVEGQWQKHGNPSSPQPQTGCGDNALSEAINFDQRGYFVKDNPGLKPDVWYLIYEKPGAPALSVELIFDDKSVCVLADKQGSCPDVFLTRSSLTRVQGIVTENGAVRVISAN
jgi:hypothetical protein